jgi:DNA repair exonuclease SbcCD ATPase subunit
MSVSDAEHQTCLQNQYFVDTGVQPFDSLYQWYQNTKKEPALESEQERRIKALETQIAELQGQLKPATDLAETRKTQIAELTTQNAELTTQNAELTTQNAELKTQNAELKTQNAQTKQGSQIMRLDNQISQLSTHIHQLENSRLQNLCKETTFACQLLESAVKAVSQENLYQDNNLFLHVQTIKRYMQKHASPAADLLITLQRQTDHLANLKDGHGLDTSSLTENQHQVVIILLALMLLLINDKHFKIPKSAAQLYGDVMTNYYNTHASNWRQMGEASHEVQKLLDVEQRTLELKTAFHNEE